MRSLTCWRRSLITLFSSADTNLPITVFRLLRCFRVLRIFGRLGSIRSIINALTASLLPVLNAFFIMGIVVMLYAIIGVTFFAESAPFEMGNFSRAVVTLFRIAGGETWIGEPPDEGMPIINDEGYVNWGTAAFVMSFIVIVNWTLLQVLVAVLLDNFVAETAR